LTTGSGRLVRIVTIGGGHGQSIMLKALSKLSCDIGAVVAVSDDGGCSGILRQEYNMPPPGDIRRCLSALANNRDMAKIFETRFQLGKLKGRSFGNLFLANLWNHLGNLQHACDVASNWLSAQGKVMPASLKPGTLVAITDEGLTIEGETAIDHFDSKPRYFGMKNCFDANPIAIEAIYKADIIILGPGSFYTSVLSPLSLTAIAWAYSQSKAYKLLMLNLEPDRHGKIDMNAVDYLNVLSEKIDRYAVKTVDAIAVDKQIEKEACIGLNSSIKVLSGNFRESFDSNCHNVSNTARLLSNWLNISYSNYLPSINSPLREFQVHVN